MWADRSLARTQEPPRPRRHPARSRCRPFLGPHRARRNRTRRRGPRDQLRTKSCPCCALPENRPGTETPSSSNPPQNVTPRFASAGWRGLRALKIEWRIEHDGLVKLLVAVAGRAGGRQFGGAIAIVSGCPRKRTNRKAVRGQVDGVCPRRTGDELYRLDIR